MSRTFKTKSGSNFFTNVNSERLIGHLFKTIGYKYYVDEYLLKEAHPSPYTMPYDDNTSKKEVDSISEKLLALVEQSDILYPTFKHYFGKECTHDDFSMFLKTLAVDIKNTKGYKEI